MEKFSSQSSSSIPLPLTCFGLVQLGIIAHKWTVQALYAPFEKFCKEVPQRNQEHSFRKVLLYIWKTYHHLLIENFSSLTCGPRVEKIYHGLVSIMIVIFLKGFVLSLTMTPLRLERFKLMKLLRKSFHTNYTRSCCYLQSLFIKYHIWSKKKRISINPSLNFEEKDDSELTVLLSTC